MKKYVLLICILAMCILLAAVVYILPGMIMTGKRQTLDEAMQWQSDHYDTSFYGALKKTPYTITAEDGYALHAELLRNLEKSSRYVILSHGYTDNRVGSLKYVQIYLDLGFNCIIYDLRGHGENEPTFTTYGIREGKDLRDIVEDTRKRYPELTALGLHGESLGAATTVLSLRYQPKVDFAVADCAFSDIENVLQNGFKSAHLPGVTFSLANLGAHLHYHYALSKMRPVDALSWNRTPLCLIHGADDSQILPQNSQTLYDAAKGYKEIHLIEGAGHAESVLTEPKEYEEILREFLKKVY